MNTADQGLTQSTLAYEWTVFDSGDINMMDVYGGTLKNRTTSHVLKFITKKRKRCRNNSSLWKPRTTELLLLLKHKISSNWKPGAVFYIWRFYSFADCNSCVFLPQSESELLPTHSLLHHQTAAVLSRDELKATHTHTPINRERERGKEMDGDDDGGEEVTQIHVDCSEPEMEILR